MRYPSELLLMRHGESDFNALKKVKDADPEYQEFVALFHKKFNAIDLSKPGLYPDRWVGKKLQMLARKMWSKYRLSVSDYDTPLTSLGHAQAFATGIGLKERTDIAIPDVIYVSPYLRTRQTLQGIIKGFPQLQGVKIISEELLVEQQHGLCILYNDWRMFFVLNPQQGLLRKMDGEYHYCFPNGENKPMVRNRARQMFDIIKVNNSRQRVWMITHHLMILSIMSELGGWDREKFLKKDKEEKPLNCGVTIYLGNHETGEFGIPDYNRKFYL